MKANPNATFKGGSAALGRRSERAKLIHRNIELESENLDLLKFVRDQMEIWDNDGDSGFPLYDEGKRILARYKFPDKKGQR